MVDGDVSPGPIAQRTFDRASKLAVLLGLAGVGLLYWTGVLSITNGFHVTMSVALFPVYVLTVGVLLGVWLGFETDASDLQRVTVERTDDER